MAPEWPEPKMPPGDVAAEVETSTADQAVDATTHSGPVKSDPAIVDRLTSEEYDRLPEVLNSLEVARILTVNRQQVSRWAAEGKLPGAQIGRTWRFSKSTIERIVAGGWMPDE